MDPRRSKMDPRMSKMNTRGGEEERKATERDTVVFLNGKYNNNASRMACSTWSPVPVQQRHAVSQIVFAVAQIAPVVATFAVHHS